MGYIYKIKIYTKKVTQEKLEVFIDNLRKISEIKEYIFTLEQNKIIWQIVSSKEIIINNDILFPFKIIKSEDILNKTLAKTNIVPHIYKSNISDIIKDMYLKSRDITFIKLKTLPWNISINKYLLGYIYFKNKTRKRIIIKNLVAFLNISTEDNVRFETVLAEPQRNKLFIESNNPILLSDDGSIGIDNFDFNKHSFIIGQSGSGKSKFIELLTKRIVEEKALDNYVIIIIDPHDNIFQKEILKESIDIDFKEKTLNLFTNTGEPLTSTELTIDLFSTLIDIKSNYYLYRVLKYSLFLLYTIKEMNLVNLKNLLTDILYRKSLLKKTSNITIKDFFELEFFEIESKRYTDSILPILNLISEFLLISNESETKFNLENLICDHKYINLSPNIARLGSKITKLISGSIVEQVFILTQTGNIKKKIILIIDEVPIVENPSFVKILAEARKFNLSIYLSCQYTRQLSADLKNAITSNVINYFCFKMGREDAKTILNSIDIRFNPNSIRGKKYEEIKEEEIRLITDLNPRNLIVRVMRNDKFLYPALMKTKNI